MNSSEEEEEDDIERGLNRLSEDASPVVRHRAVLGGLGLVDAFRE